MHRDQQLPLPLEASQPWEQFPEEVRRQALEVLVTLCLHLVNDLDEKDLDDDPCHD